MVQAGVKIFFLILLTMIGFYGFVRDSGMMKKTIQHKFMKYDVNEENVDSRVRLARAAHLTILGDKPKNFPICSRINPCGWQLYKTPGRHIEGFLWNNCRCHENATCVKDNDDLSTSTFQYRCHENITESDTFAPTEDIVQSGVVSYDNN